MSSNQEATSRLITATFQQLVCNTNRIVFSSVGILQVEIDGSVANVVLGKSVAKSGFSLSIDTNDEIKVQSLATEVVISLGKDGHTWSVGVPPAYRSHTVGLCGTCDDNCDNDMWDGKQVGI